MDIYKKMMNKKCGVGGLHCDCCNRFHGKDRKILNRMVRRTLKQKDEIKIDQRLQDRYDDWEYSLTIGNIRKTY